MDDKAAKELTKALDRNTKAVEELRKDLRKSDGGKRRSHSDPAQPADTQKLKG